MRTPFAISRTARLLGAALALALMAAPAHAADAPFTPRFAQTAHGDIAAVGNTVLTCPTATAGCTNAQNGLGGTLNNNNWNMTPVNASGGTVNSSSATVNLPAAATVPVGRPVLGRRHERRDERCGGTERRRQGHGQVPGPGRLLSGDLRGRPATSSPRACRRRATAPSVT